MTKTRKELIIENYLILKSALEEFIDGSLFPSLDDYDITDIVYYLNLYFPKNKEEEYINTIEKLMNQKGIQINDDDFTTVVNLIIDFINFLNNL
jgi:predicted nucleic acid-binding protein